MSLMMNNEEKYEYWLDIAQYDLATAETMYRDGRWLYVVFMCQQAIEKLVKGLYGLYLPDTPPKLHDINAIFAKFENKLQEQCSAENTVLFDQLSAFYLNNRYPEYTKKLSAAVTEDRAKEILEKSKRAFAWLETLKP
ncbi:MAG: HEPN domain-containing protein [Treponemataceae bacterium]|nr:MAG: HEPN domain-containing protein [Treponemataceae bacterium]